MQSYTTTALVVAAGSGTRMKSRINKPYLMLSGKHIISYCLDAFEASSVIDAIVLVVNANDHEYVMERVLKKTCYSKITAVTAGGSTRQESVYAGLMACPDSDIILIHDSVRPFISDEMIKRAVTDAAIFGAGVVAVPVTNTIKQADGDLFVKSTPERKDLWEVQTPQTFKAGLIIEAYRRVREQSLTFTDDASVAEHAGHKVRITAGSVDNIKITSPKDLLLAELILREIHKT